MKNEHIAGLHAVEAVLRQDPLRVLRLYVRRGRGDRRLQALLTLAERHGVPVEFVEARRLDGLAGGLRHQGVVALCKASAALGTADLYRLLDGLEEAPFLLVLDGVTDPHNLGACLRSAEAACVHAVIAPRHGAPGITPVVRKVASGAAERVPYVQVGNLAQTLDALRERGIWLVGTSDRAPKDLYAQDLTGPLALVMGAEGSGLRRLTAERCDFLVRIPMCGQVASLNVSVATGVCLFEAVRQRRPAT